uniref:Uncharacterized protein n=1 Tax=Avena sativa TaxID=4498 RepID=A0ACD5VAM2_AVESA
MSTSKIVGFFQASTPLLQRSSIRFSFSDPSKDASADARCCLPVYRTCVRRTRSVSSSSSSSVHVERTFEGQNASLQIMERKTRIQKRLHKPEYLLSPYHTAWVAMVPSYGSPEDPYFPQCIEWIMQNQHDNGSWGINEFDSSANKDILLSTLACIIALKKWNVGSDQISRGLRYMGRNLHSVMDMRISAPTGFNLTFPSLLSLAIGMGLEFPIREADVDDILRLREIELNRLAGEKSSIREAYLRYVAEGSVDLLDWNEVMMYQRKNGSLFNSPSKTAAALIHHYDGKSLEYLQLLLDKFGNADTLQKLGISHHFSSDIKGILDTTYRLWLQGDEEILLDMETCAMAFRILRMNGYDISSDDLSHIAVAPAFENSLQKYLKATKSILELYKASEVILTEHELVLENIGCRSESLLKDILCSSDSTQNMTIFGEVEHALNFPFYTTVEPMDHRRNIEHLDARISMMLQNNYLPPVVNQDLLSLAIEDFSLSQSVYQDELKHLYRWEKENMLDKLQFVRQRLAFCYFAAVSTISHHELSDARIACAKNVVLTIVIDDFFDVGGSQEELENLVALTEMWEDPQEDAFYSEQVKIVYSAIYSTVNKLGAMASVVQNRDDIQCPVEIWQKLIRCMMTEAEWQRRKYVPTIEEYMIPATFSIAVAPMVLPAQYFLGEMLTEYMVRDEEYKEMCRLMSTICRLLNDTRTLERESGEGKLNSVSLLIHRSGGSMSIEEAKNAIQKSVVACRRDLLRLVLREDSVVPRKCKELFWRHSKTAFLFYFQADEFTSPKELVGKMNAVINEPLKLQTNNPSWEWTCQVPKESSYIRPRIFFPGIVKSYSSICTLREDME